MLVDAEFNCLEFDMNRDISDGSKPFGENNQS